MWFDERCFSQLKSDRTGNHFTVGVKTGQPPFLFSRCGKVWGRRFNQLIDLSQQTMTLFSGALIQGGYFSINIIMKHSSSVFKGHSREISSLAEALHDEKDLKYL